MQHYNAYNLGIKSSLLLPELLTQAEAKDDVTIRIESGLRLQSNDNLSSNPYSITPTKAHLNFSEVGIFFINNGSEITIDSLPSVEERLIRLPLLGAAMAVLLYQRGKFVLHASAIEKGGQAIAFVGNKGDGKSTMAAMLCSRGHSLLADDTVAIDFNLGAHPMVLPAFPQSKLYPDAVIAAAKDDPDKLEEIASNINKRSRQVKNFCSDVLPLKAIYVLKESKKVQINQLPIQEALHFLIAHSYMARFTSEWIRSGIAASNLQHCAAAVNQIPVYVLERPRNLSALENVAMAVENHS